ncbi:MAG TPA: D-alanyl-D-alanine carboxypeptidase/D-alanyl-D-alanine-endopeptidase, partial [Phycisphaerae bacterium]|nr:D-alanyl-D-alanine carboxypeptidase/D-alanyl-D-alanine-endopeptidase [Phycisphaerae bacterium]
MDDRHGLSRISRKVFAGVAMLLAAGAVRAESLAPKINAILNNDQLKNASVSVTIAEVTPRGLVEHFTHDPDLALAPASNTKLMTTACAFEKYGSKAAFKTTLYKVGEDLLIVGGGDPALGDARLAENPDKPAAIFELMASELVKAGVTKFRDLIIDDRVFDYQFTHPAWPDDQKLSEYEAPVGGLNFNANCLDWKVVLSGDNVGVQIIPPTTYVSVAVKATRGAKTAAWMYRPATSNKFELRGTVAGTAKVAESVTILDPGLWTGTVARDTIVAVGVSSTGRVRRLAATDDMSSAKVIATASTPVMNVIHRANKQSLNMMAEALCKRIGHDDTGKPGTWENGTAAVMKYAVSCGAKSEDVFMDDGSGLSAKNRISSRAFTTVLAHVAASKEGELFVNSLAVPGEDGTLKRRFEGMSVASSVHAKTGHINGVSTLSGYIDIKGAGGTTRRFVFSILCNKYVGNVNPLQD